MADFWQARPLKWWPHPFCATAAIFYFGSLASGGPEFKFPAKIKMAFLKF
jgi:hypothetical protein